MVIGICHYLVLKYMENYIHIQKNKIIIIHTITAFFVVQTPSTNKNTNNQNKITCSNDNQIHKKKNAFVCLLYHLGYSILETIDNRLLVDIMCSFFIYILKNLIENFSLFFFVNNFGLFFCLSKLSLSLSISSFSSLLYQSFLFLFFIFFLVLHQNLLSLFVLLFR